MRPAASCISTCAPKQHLQLPVANQINKTRPCIMHFLWRNMIDFLRASPDGWSAGMYMHRHIDDNRSSKAGRTSTGSLLAAVGIAGLLHLLLHHLRDTQPSQPHNAVGLIVRQPIKTVLHLHHVTPGRRDPNSWTEAPASAFKDSRAGSGCGSFLAPA